MKEIDFIPEWYKTGQKRIVGYHRQYILITVLFVVLLVWSHAAGSFVSRVKAEVNRVQNLLEVKTPLAQVYCKMKETVANLQANAHVLERVEPRVDLSHVIAELSYLVSDQIVLSKIDIQSEAVQAVPTGKKKDVVRIAAGTGRTSSALPEESTRSKVTIAGIAARGSDVASLISKLEESSWFCRVIPGYSRSKETKGVMTMEFEIGCYVANYVPATRGSLQ